MIGHQRRERELDAAEDHGEEVIEVVRDASSQNAETLELLRAQELHVGGFEFPRALLDEVFEAGPVLVELELRASLNGDVRQVDGETDDLAAVGPDRAVHVVVDATLHPLVAIFFADREVLAREGAVEVALRLVAIVGTPDDFEHRAADANVDAPDRLDGRRVILVEREVAVFAVEREDHDVAWTLEHRSEHGLRLLKRPPHLAIPRPSPAPFPFQSRLLKPERQGRAARIGVPSWALPP
jgi:hypothetical protein